MLFHRTIAGFLLLVWIAPAACTRIESDGAGPGAPGFASSGPAGADRSGLLARAKPPIVDLPVPIGFQLAESISRGYESAGVRFVDHTYEGRADKADLERFYRRHMPLKGWTVRSSQMVRGAYLLRCEKHHELCDVTIDSRRSALGREIASVHFNVQPVSGGVRRP